MWNQMLCLGMMGSYGNAQLSAEEGLRLMAQTGFEGFFSGWGGAENLRECRRLAGEIGLYYQSVHAPFGSVRALWHGTEEQAQAALDELLLCLEDCAAVEGPVMVSHVYVGFKYREEPNEAGLARFETLVRRAAQLGVKIAFENTEGLAYLDAVMEMAAAYPEAAGFCWDTVHEMCYNASTDMPGRYPGRLLATHINDNLGVRDFGGKTTWHDDLHLLPFDGIGDWADAARRLKDFEGPLTFELTTKSKPERHENDKYARLPPEEYLAEAYARACRVAALVRRAREKG